MTVVANTSLVKASMSTTDRKAVTGFTPVEQKPELSFSAAPNTTTYNYVLTESGTLAASANTTVDLYAITTDLGETANTTKLAGYLFKALPTNTSALGGQFRVEQGASNPATLFLGGTGPYLLAPVNTTGVCFFVMSGSHETLNTTVRNVLLSNPGSNTISYYMYAFLGT